MFITIISHSSSSHAIVITRSAYSTFITIQPFHSSDPIPIKSNSFSTNSSNLTQAEPVSHFHSTDPCDPPDPSPPPPPYAIHAKLASPCYAN